MKTLIALTTALRNLWLLSQGLLLAVVLDPGWGLYQAAVELAGSPEALLRGAMALTLGGLLWEHFLGILTRKRQAALARALLRLQPGLQHVEAIRILIRAMSGDNPELLKTIHQQLVKLTGKDLGTDPGPWQQWLETQEKIATGKLELDPFENIKASSDQESSQ
ncbi:MAG: hypothetical protein AAEJ04_04905 [Planctomycetota bacterium]